MFILYLSLLTSCTCRTKNKDFWRGKKVIELGSGKPYSALILLAFIRFIMAGLGHLAWGLYKLGANVISIVDMSFTCQPNKGWGR